MQDLSKKLVEYSFTHQLSHIPSALSMLDYVHVLFAQHFVKPSDFIVIGKPFGAQAYYLVWQELGLLDSIEHLSVSVKHDEISFVDYGEETLGNALGVAAGIAIATDNKQVWVNLSDATLQMGNTLEAIQFIGHNCLSDILVTVDYNGAQVTGSTHSILSVDPIIDMCYNYGWDVRIVDGHDNVALTKTFIGLDNTKPKIVFCRTRKGYGYPSMTSDTKKWHYKKIESEQELQRLLDEKNTTPLSYES